MHLLLVILNGNISLEHIGGQGHARAGVYKWFRHMTHNQWRIIHKRESHQQFVLRRPVPIFLQSSQRTVDEHWTELPKFFVSHGMCHAVLHDVMDVDALFPQSHIGSA
jgi:hypothetical protein